MVAAGAERRLDGAGSIVPNAEQEINVPSRITSNGSNASRSSPDKNVIVPAELVALQSLLNLSMAKTARYYRLRGPTQTLSGGRARGADHT